ncbi:hypothetical protein [Streptomyces sp. CAU 1734]|uniref:tetratricopeptide repeat protein n=1 Tax=Streptomyces sp. CAU 1734 TaxID=3140360 RepID=UPI0032603059
MAHLSRRISRRWKSGSGLRLRLGRDPDRPVTAARLAELGMLPRDRQNARRPGPDPRADLVVAAARSGRWRPGAELLEAIGTDWERRTAVIGELAGAAAVDDAWLERWRAERPDDPGSAGVQAMAMIELAWRIRGGNHPSRTEQERSEGFFRILNRSGRAIARARELGERDPSPDVADIWRGIGLSRSHEDMHRLWAQTSARDPYHHLAHRGALEYWSAHWHGSRERAAAFAAESAGAAPPGALLSSLRLAAWWYHLPAEPHDREFRTGEPAEAVDLLREDVAAARPNHPYLPEARHMLAYFLIRQGRAALALEQFRLVDGWVGAFPWNETEHPAELYGTLRDRAVNLTGG